MSEQWVVYDYDVELPDPQVLDYPTWHNRLLEYRVYDGDPNDPGTNRLRTVKYAYYKTGQASNITIKDEGVGPEYDTYKDLALYYYSHGPLWRVIWGEFERNPQGQPTDYRTTAAREFRSDSARARYLVIDYDTHGSDNPGQWTVGPTFRTDYDGDLPYRDVEVAGEGAETELMHYLGTVAQQPLDENGIPTDTLFLHGDLIGSTNLTTDAAGDPADQVAYTAFGEILDASGSPGGDPPEGFPRYQYAGAWGYESGGFGDDPASLGLDRHLLVLPGVNPNLPAITLQHVGHRWYEPNVGRFIQRDPIGIDGGLNVYEYVFSHPLSLVDPSGLATGKTPWGWREVKTGRWTKPPWWWRWGKGVGRRFPVYVGGRLVARGVITASGMQWEDPEWLCFDTTYWCIRAWGPQTWFRPPPRQQPPGGPPPPVPPRGPVPPTCLVAGTPVWSEGEMVVVELLEAGAWVDSAGLDEGPVTRTKILATRRALAADIVVVVLPDEVICCTPAHLFWVTEGGWVRACNLRSGDHLQSSDGDTVAVLDVRRKKLRDAVPVYDVMVDGTHTYLVGRSRVVVHNKVILY